MLERFQNNFLDDFEHLAEKINLDEGEVKGAGGGIKSQGNSKPITSFKKSKRIWVIPSLLVILTSSSFSP